MASQNVSHVVENHDFRDLEIAFEQSLQIVSLDAEEGVVHDVFRHRLVSIFGSERALLLDFLLNELALKSGHGLFDLVL